VIMAKNPKQYGLTDLVPDAPVLSDTVTTEYSISIPLVADLTNSSVQDVVALNPALLRLSTPKDIPYDLHLPKGTRQIYLDRLKDIPEEDRASWRFHVVKDGETLETIASSLHSRPSEIASVNEIPAGDPPEAGDELVVPVSVSGGSGQRTYRPRRGDTLVTVADRFGVSVENLRSWNHLSSNRLTTGHVLLVAEPVRLAPAGRGSRSRRGAHVASAKGAKSHGRAEATHVAARSASHGSAHSPQAAVHTAVHGAAGGKSTHAAAKPQRTSASSAAHGHAHHGR